MTFFSFAEHLSSIESTSKRLAITDLLVSLMKETPADQIDKMVYLALGQLAPLYADKDFGLAEKMLLRAAALAFDTEARHVQAMYKKLGDLGNVVQELSKRSRRERKQLSVTDVFERLNRIADEAGEGSQERKLTQASQLLRAVDPLSAKYLTRILLRTLRLGFSDKTVLDALSVLTRGDKSARDQIEDAYNVLPDVGELSRRIKAHGLSGIARVEPRIGTPILPALCQRLPSAEEIIEKMNTVAVEPKWDGQRIQAHAWISRKKEEGKRQKELQQTIFIKLFTRNLEDVTAMFPDLVNSVKYLFKPSSFYPFPSSFILDGEAVGVNPKTGRTLPFQTMITRKRKYGIQEQLRTVPIRYMIFDVLYLNGRSLIAKPFSERRAGLERLFRRLPSTVIRQLSLAPQLVTDDPGQIRIFLKKQVAAGLEGFVAKQLAAPYVPGRTGFTWVKMKWEGGAKAGGLLDTIDCVVMGTNSGRGKRSSFGVGAFLVGVLSDLSNLRYLTISKIGTGLSDEQWRELKVQSSKFKVQSSPKEYSVPKELTPDIWLRPELVVEIQADNITKSPLHSAGYALRFPRLVRYRSDKRPDQATTLKEIGKLYQMQK